MRREEREALLAHDLARSLLSQCASRVLSSADVLLWSISGSRIKTQDVQSDVTLKNTQNRRYLSWKISPEPNKDRMAADQGLGVLRSLKISVPWRSCLDISPKHHLEGRNNVRLMCLIGPLSRKTRYWRRVGARCACGLWGKDVHVTLFITTARKTLG
jgi:hypothetical protein